MNPATIRKLCVRPVVLLLPVLVGCEGWNLRLTPPEPAPPPKPAQTADALTAGTIGAQTLLTEVDVQALRGFGVVVGLNGRGSGDCPTAIREYLIDYLSKQLAPQGTPDRRPRMSPSQLIDSLNTAVVEVLGIVPAGARKGTHFDLRVQTIPGTSTQSLEGGLLLPTQMRFFDPSAGGEGLFAGSVLAEAGGPMFINPFATAGGSSSDADPCRGYVLGGGKALEPRPARLMLLQPNYDLARRIERRINERFGQKPKVAEAQSRGYIVLNTPPEYAPHPEHFRQLVARLYLDNQPTFIERKLRELDSLAVGPNANLEGIALAWEALGRGVIGHLQSLYTHPDDALRFEAARAGVRLNDTTAVPVLAQIASTANHSQRLLAMRTLGDCDSPQAPLALVPLLSDEDQEIRIAAYEALLQHGHPAVKSIKFAHIQDQSQINFILDVVDSQGPPFVYVRRTRLPRIAVFGSRLAITPPVFFTYPQDAVTVHSTEGADDIRLFTKRGNKMSDELSVPPRVVSLIAALADLPFKDRAGKLRGIGLPYSRVVQVLADLCKSEAIPARLVLEQTTLTDLLGPEFTPERPERPEREPASQTAPAPPPAAEAGKEAARPPGREPPPERGERPERDPPPEREKSPEPP